MTMGHVNIVERAARLFDTVVIAVLQHPDKRALFTPEERVEMIEAVFAGQTGIQVDRFDGLLVDYVRRRGGQAVIRGLRAVQDFEYEFQMTSMNRRLAPEVDSVFLMTDEKHFYTASRTVKEVAALGGDVRGLVPEAILDRMLRRLGRAP
jgi:pantetheine-phosphate adenylyltransferase